MIERRDAVRELRAGRAVPLARALPADLLTPVGALGRLLGGEAAFRGGGAGAAGAAFLFESVERGERIGRYSYVGVAPERLAAPRFRSLLADLA